MWSVDLPRYSTLTCVCLKKHLAAFYLVADLLVDYTNKGEALGASAETIV